MISALNRRINRLSGAAPGHYAIALLFVLVALVVRIALVPWLDYRAPFLLFNLSIMMAALLGGLGPGLLATTTALLSVWYFLVPRLYSFTMDDRGDVLNLVIFFFVGVGISISSDRLRSAVVRSNRTQRTTEALLESASQSILGVRQDGSIALVNALAERMFGYSRTELIGQPLELLIPESKRNIHRSHRESFHADPHARPMGVGMELRGRRKDGTEFPAEVSLSSVETDDGRLSVAFISDIGDRLQVAEALRQQAKMIDLALDPIFTWNLGGVIRSWNHGAEILYGFSSSEARGRVSHELLQTVLPLPAAVFDAKLAADGKWIGELIHTARDGTRIVVESRMSLFPRPNDVPIVVETNRDITERKRVAEEILSLNAGLDRRVQERTAQLEAANRELEAFAYSVSHDLRAPLRGIDGWSMALLEDYGEQLDDRARGYLTRVRTETQRLGQLIDDLLQLSRVTRVNIRPQTVELSMIAAQICARLAESEPEREIQFIIAPGLTAEGDPRLLEAVLVNLLDNAVKFTRGRPNQRVEFGRIEGPVETPFFVRDNGVGFDMRYAAKLFGVFQRLHKSSEFPGTGIGLATVERIVHRHGGQVRAESVLDQETTFYFALPL
jgi:PAS domain S-box-containing protein